MYAIPYMTIVYVTYVKYQTVLHELSEITEQYHTMRVREYEDIMTLNDTRLAVIFDQFFDERMRYFILVDVRCCIILVGHIITK